MAFFLSIVKCVRDFKWNTFFALEESSREQVIHYSAGPTVQLYNGQYDHTHSMI